MVDKDSFEEWLANPVTKEFRRMLTRYSARSRQRWETGVWAAQYLGHEEQVALAYFKARTELSQEIATLDYETYEEFADDLIE